MWRNLAPPTMAGMFGDSWRSNLEEQLSFSDPNVTTYYRSDGSSLGLRLERNLLSPNNVAAQLTTAGGRYAVQFSDGTKRLFSPLGQLQSMVDRNGNQATLSYDNADRLSSVTDAAEVRSLSPTATRTTGTRLPLCRIRWA